MNEFERKIIEDIELNNIIVLCELLEENLEKYRGKYNLNEFYAKICYVRDQLEMILDRDLREI
jgi:hypothetical protein